MDKFQRIDILVNNAAIYPMARLAEMETALWDKVLGVNLRGPFLCTRFAAEQMIAGGCGGRIINISSINTARDLSGHGPLRRQQRRPQRLYQGERAGVRTA